MSTDIETASGKGHRDENFPVGSFLLPAALRPHVAAFYAFARAADDIADNAHLTAKEKVARLTRFAAALEGDAGAMAAVPKAARLRESCQQTRVPLRHGLDLLAAFRQDAVKGRYQDWSELRAYCQSSASPVGRFLLDLHGEQRGLWTASDALCDALQVLNHLQDCQDDYRKLDRVYLPEDWLEAAGETVAALGASAASPGLRQVIDQCLDATDSLLAEAGTLIPGLKSRRLAMESAVIHKLACRLSQRLRRGDPLATRVALSKGDFARCGIAGVFAGLFPAKSGTAARAKAVRG